MRQARETDSYEELITRLYLEAFPITATFVSRMGGSFEQARDVFQDALVIYYEQVICTGKEIKSSEKAYLLGIAKHLWYQEYKTETIHESLSKLETDVPFTPHEEEPSAGRLIQFLGSAGQKCMEVLKAFYYDKLSLSKISDQFGFSSVRSATVQKYKCLEKVREEVKERKLVYEDLVD